MSKKWFKEKTTEAGDKIVVGFFQWLILGVGAVVIGLGFLLFFHFEEQPKFMNHPERNAGKWTRFPENGYDKLNRYAKFIFVAFSSDRFSWARGETNVLILDGKRLSEKEVKRVVFSDLSNLIENSGGLVAIGTSSQEGKRPEEEKRALQRSEQLASWLRSGISENKGLFRLSLGQYLKTSKINDGSKTNYQRPAVIVCILEWDKNVNMRQALVNAMLKQRDLPNPEDYSTLKFREIQKIQSPPFSFRKSIARILKSISDKFNIFG